MKAGPAQSAIASSPFRHYSILFPTLSVLAVAGLAWWSLLASSGTMAPVRSEPTIWMGGLTFLAGWGVMMIAMMLPSATPMIALYGRARRRSPQAGRSIPTALFALIYLGVWLLFGVPVYAADALLGLAVRLYQALARLFPYGVALVLLVGGIYQFSTFKTTCLRSCRAPLQFFIGRWRAGYAGTALLALKHSLNCVGCCWALMVILVAAGAMALHWVLLIAAMVAVEKLLPYGEWTARLIGVGLIALGLVVALQPDVARAMHAAM